jgi:hypothetical protein
VAQAEFGADLRAVFMLGSLAHGGFAPLVSDIDVALVLRTVDAGTAARVARVVGSVQTEEPGELASRLSVFWSDWNGVRAGAGAHARLPEIDRADLIQDGTLIAGEDRRAGAAPPSHEDLVTSGARFAVTMFTDDYLASLAAPERHLARGARGASKVVLFPIRFMYTLERGSVGHNHDAAVWYEASGAFPQLARAALDWRESGVGDGRGALELLRAQLIPLHREFLGRYDPALRRLGEEDLADAVAHARRRLGEPPHAPA